MTQMHTTRCTQLTCVTNTKIIKSYAYQPGKYERNKRNKEIKNKEINQKLWLLAR